MIIDASVILSAFFPDEAQSKSQALIRDHIAGRVDLRAPALLPYEIANAVCQAERRGRISASQGDKILQTFAGLKIEVILQSADELMPLARDFGRSAYDAAYMRLAQATDDELITNDERMYHAAKAQLKWVKWIGDYTSPMTSPI